MSCGSSSSQTPLLALVFFANLSATLAKASVLVMPTQAGIQMDLRTCHSHHFGSTEFIAIPVSGQTISI